MTTYQCCGFADLERKLKKHMLARAKRLRNAIKTTAKHGANYIREKTVPVAFSELRDSIHVAGKGIDISIIADAPHAQAVEIGSRPHMPNIETLTKWVKLRASEGLLALGPRGRPTRAGLRRLSRLSGSTTTEHALSIAGQMRAMGHGGAVSVRAPEAIAWAIAIAISRHGTRPHWYARQALPEISKKLDQELRAALEEKEG